MPRVDELSGKHFAEVQLDFYFSRRDLSYFFVGQKVINTGKKINVPIKVLIIEIVSNAPMLEVPGWLDKAMLPKEPIVVKAENSTALGVVVPMTSSI